MKYQKVAKINLRKITTLAIIITRDQRDVEFFEKEVKSPEPVELLLNETREKFVNIMRMLKEYEKRLPYKLKGQSTSQSS